MAEFWIYLSALIIVLYVLLSALIIFSIRRQKEATAKDTSELPTVSLVIAARNEEENLPALFTSLKMLDYPAHLLEIILIDDGSIDQTRKIAEAQQAALPCPRNTELIQRFNTRVAALRAGLQPCP